MLKRSVAVVYASRSLRKLTNDLPLCNTASFFPRLTAHREIILATFPLQNRLLYVVEKNSHEPCSVHSSKHRLAEIPWCPWPTSQYFMSYLWSSQLLLPFSSIISICSCLFVFLLFHHCIINNILHLIQKPRAQGTWFLFHRKDLVFNLGPWRNLVLLYSLTSWHYLCSSGFVLLIWLHWLCVS